MTTQTGKWRGSIQQLGGCIIATMVVAVCGCGAVDAQASNGHLAVKVNRADGSYSIGMEGAAEPVFRSGAAAEVDGHWLLSRNYPRHDIKSSSVSDDLGMAQAWIVTFSGLDQQPDLIYSLRSYSNHPFADIQVFVRNTTLKSINVEAIRSIVAEGHTILNLGGTETSDRILSDSFSEDRPNITIRDFGQFDDGSDNLYRAVGSQLIYNRASRQSFFIGALTSDKFLTILRIHLTGDAGAKHIAAYEVDSTGTTEEEELNSLQESAPADRVTLELPVAPGEQLASERLLLSVGTDYHQQLETYARIIRNLHHARISAPSPMGWWSWTAYYFGLNGGAALTNAQWEAQHLKQLGYDFFHIDEGYQYARGEYTTPNATNFPNGLADMEREVTGMGLVPGIWTAPFEVSERSWVYQHHPDWLVHNAHGQPIHAGFVVGHKDALFMLDCTNPGAQEYLQQTYMTLVREWGIRYIKLDFMDDSAIEGYYYRPHTTAMEAQRIGLRIIRQAVGNRVLLDKDGSVMMNPVGYVDFGRISQDTGHTFDSSRDAASGIAARYYRNRNYFVADPDAFTVSKQTVDDHSWHGGTHPLTLDEAKVSIALAAVAGGMYEIGDDLPMLGSEPHRLALVQNQELIDMIRLGRSSTPIDLMSYLPEGTEQTQSHSFTPAALGLNGASSYAVDEVFDRMHSTLSASSALVVSQPPHSVRVLKIVEGSIAPVTSAVHAEHPADGKTGVAAIFTAQIANPASAVISYEWQMGDGVTLQGPQVRHAYTHPGTYAVTLRVTGIDGLSGENQFQFSVTGTKSTRFVPVEIRRLAPPK